MNPRNLLLVVLLSFSISMLGQWIPQNPFPAPNNFLKADLINDSTYVMVGWHFFTKTSNYGQDWTVVDLDSILVSSVDFVNDSIGYAVGINILKTTDGGNTWNKIGNLGDGWINDVFFLDENVGSIGFARTIDGGLNWIIAETLPTPEINSIFFVDYNNGWTVGGNKICRTMDGGDNWFYIEVGADDLTDIFMIDSEHGWAISNGGGIFHTSDGFTWGSCRVDLPNWLESVYFISLDTGFICGSDENYNGIIIKTTDGGLTWSECSQPQSKRLFDIKFNNSEFGIAVGETGTVLKSYPDGNIWYDLTTGFHNNLRSTYFIDDYTGWAVGYNGSIIKTIDGGENWYFKESGSNEDFNEVIFVNYNLGFSCSDQGRLIKTTDGGENWSDLYSFYPGPAKSVFFIDEQKGWIFANDHINWTINSGGIWIADNSGNCDNINDLCFTSDQVGYACGNKNTGGKIIKTTNGGITWTEVYYTSYEELITIMFVDDLTGWSVSDDQVYKTTDGGLTWNIYYLHNSVGSVGEPPGLFFKDYNNGWITGIDGLILYSADGGITWTKQESGTLTPLRSVYFSSDEMGWIVGLLGTVYHTNNGGTVNISEAGFTSSLCLATNQFPNPVVNTTAISYFLPKTESVVIRLFNAVGQPLKILENSTQGEGNHQLLWDATGYPSGIYFYRIETSAEIGSGKMIVTK